MSILVTGATGKLGRLVVERLLGRGQNVRILTRRPDAAFALFSHRVEIVVGSFSDRAALAAAVSGIEKLFLLSPISESLVADQVAVIDAAVAANVGRIVKISGSDWTIEPPGASLSGDAHATVERHLQAQELEQVSIRPNAWMQVGLAATIAEAAKAGVLPARHGQAGVSYIDARDIADVAVHQLLSPHVAKSPLVLTGGAALTIDDVASLVAASIYQPVSVSEVAAPAQSVADESLEHRAVRQFMTLIAEGRAAPVTGTVAQLLGRAPRSVAAFIAEYFSVSAPTQEKIA